MTGLEIRTFFRELFGSRVSSTLEEELLRTRQDYEARLLEYVHQAAALREQLAQQSAKIEKYEMVLLPMVYGNLLKPKEPPTFMPSIESDDNSWAAIQRRWEREQEESDNQSKETNDGVQK
jgi:hypothetical protein